MEDALKIVFSMVLDSLVAVVILAIRLIPMILPVTSLTIVQRAMLGVTISAITIARVFSTARVINWDIMSILMDSHVYLSIIAQPTMADVTRTASTPVRAQVLALVTRAT